MFKFIYKFKPLSLNECMLEANSHNINKPLRMLSRFITRIPALALRNRAAFSSGHDHHHDYSVAINQESPWIKYKSDPKLVCLEGVIDTNYTLQPLDNSDPFEHIRTSPLFSFSRMVFTDPWYHDDSHEPYNSAPDRGYINGQDPLQTRYLYSLPVFVSICLVGTVLLLYGFADLRIANSQALLHTQKVARDFVYDDLNDKNRILNDLKAQQAKLLAETSQ